MFSITPEGKCNCSSPHACGVVSELHTKGQKSVYMRIPFRGEGAQAQIKIESADHITVHGPKASQLQEVTHLRQHLAMKSRVEETWKNSPKAIFMLAAGPLSRNPDTLQWPSRRSRLSILLGIRYRPSSVSTLESSYRFQYSVYVGVKKQEPILK